MNLEPFRKLEHEYQTLKQKLDNHEISRAEYDAALDKLTYRDEFGREWRIDRVRGDWLLREGDKWVATHPLTAPPPPATQAPPPINTKAPRTSTGTKTSSPAPSPARPNWVPILAIGCIIGLCAGALVAALGLGALNILQGNLFGTRTPTTIAFGTPSPFASTTGDARTTETPNPTSASETAPPTRPNGTAAPTANFGQTFVAFDADFFAEQCPLFQGDNETRMYGCDFGEYYMLHKETTTRYTFYDGEFDDAVIEANGYFTKGSGKYEYGVVFRANTDGTRYYVFTVTNEGKYNVALYKDQKYTDLIPYTASPLVNTGSGMNFFQVVMRGSKFDFYLNDQYLNSVTDATIPRGVAGLFFYNAEPNAEVAFDQFTISTFTPPPPSATPPPTATPDANAVATATPSGGTVLLNDDFSGECLLFEGDNETRNYACQNGEYVMLHKVNAGRWSVYADEQDNGIFEADGRIVSGSGSYEYGVVLRTTEQPWNFYGFTVTNNGTYSVFLYKDDKYTDLIPYTQSNAVKTGTAVNRFRVIANGSQLEFYLNDQRVNTVTDATLKKGSFGFYLSNKEPNAQVAFDNVRILPIGPSQGVGTPTSAAATSAPVAPTLAVKPGVYVNSLRFTPRAPKRGQPITFFATFVNSTGRAASYKWLVEIWEADTTKRNRIGQANGQQPSIQVGTKELATEGWQIGPGPCAPYRARVVYEDPSPIPFKRTNGADLWVNFQVCP